MANEIRSIRPYVAPIRPSAIYIRSIRPIRPYTPHPGYNIPINLCEAVACI